MNERKILFRIIVDKENGGFPHASNFITKIVHKETITSEDVQGISSRVFIEDGHFSWEKVKKLMDGNNFRDITKPELLFQGIENMVFEFGMVIEDDYLQDVLSIQPLILMKMYFREQRIAAVILGESKHFFSMNYFLSDVMKRKDLMGSIFYYQKDTDNFRRLDGYTFGNKISAFYPLQIVDRDMLLFLNSNLKKSWMEKSTAGEILEQYFCGSRIVWQTVPEKFRGLIKAMPKIGFEDPEERAHAISLLEKGNTMSFLVFVFSLRNTKERKKEAVIKSFQEFQVYYRMVVDYAAGLLQLIENIVFHAGSHAGVFSMRLHSSKRDAYLQEKFPEAQESSYLEISIADYEGSNHCDNIAANFVKHMNKDEQNLFAGLTPCDLFDFGDDTKTVKPDINRAFRKYYENLDNIGTHYGLKLFREMIVNNKGAFHFYSCREHSPQDGERGGIATEAGQKAFECFPGTGYSVLLPAIPNERTAYIIGVDNQNEFKEFCKQMIAYRCKGIEPCRFSDPYETQTEKEAVIDQCVQYLCESFGSLCKDQHSVMYMDTGEYEEVHAELLYKALIKCALKKEDMPDIVFFHCKEEFVKSFCKCANTFFSRIGFEEIFSKNTFCIALYDKENVEETLIYPGSLENTYQANLLTAYARERNWLNRWEKAGKFAGQKRTRFPKIPYDILIKPDGKDTIFEQYVKKVLNKNIQGQEFGCKLENIHMRLGSTIHIATFYEAELLFSNRYFVNRFAIIVAMDIYKKYTDLVKETKNNLGLTICAYGTYSELLVFRIIEVLGYFYEKNGGDSVDYAILEREVSSDWGQHIDKFRYSVEFKSVEERKAYFKKRKMISIVPINSTLKTQDKLLEIFCRENNVSTADFILNFSLILVGASEDNHYWSLDEEDKICIPAERKTMVKPAPRYLVQLPVVYHEAGDCKLCYPDNPLEEKPLVEVNVYSTVPNQAIGLWKETDNLLRIEDYVTIFKKSDLELKKLYNSLVYSHIERNNNHFLYYIRTEKLFLEWKEDIRSWLRKKSDLIEQEDSWSANTYHILFCPVHCSNTGFVEYVNKYVFHDAALVIRMDVNKEYRSNLRTKYSNLTLLLENLGQNSSIKYTIRAHFIDDCIVTGKTFHRMQSLAQSLLCNDTEKHENIRTIIFERIFVLIDRNSGYSRQQYLCEMHEYEKPDRREELERRYFSYIHLNISSIRNHGDSCSICQLERESDGLAQTSSTWSMMKYWKNRKARFEPKTIDVYDEEQRCKAANTGENEQSRIREKSYRRMYCCHMAGTLLNEQYHGNREELSRLGILRLLIEDMKFREGKEHEQFEYFLSYLKILSRPFSVYQKAIRETIFPLLLILVQWQLEAVDKTAARDMAQISREVWKEEKSEEVFDLLKEIEKKVTSMLYIRNRKRDFLLVCMKQLMEMKSNYFLRKQNMRLLTAYIKDWEKDQELVYESYLRYVKKLTGVNSDTSKSAWLAEKIKSIMQEENPGEYLPENIMLQLLLENNRAYYDGVERLSRELKIQGDSDVEERVHSLRYQDFLRYIKSNQDITVRTIWNSIRLIRYLRDEFLQISKAEENVRKKYYDIAEMARDILGARKVYVLISTALECEQWRYELRRELDEICRILEIEEDQDEKKETEKKEYLVVSISGEHETVLEVPIPIINEVAAFEERNCDHYLGTQSDCFIWRLGVETEHPIILYAEFQYGYKKYRLDICARLMIMNNVLNETAFSADAIHYLYDIVTAESNAIKLSYYKSFSHTPEDIRKQQYSDVIRNGREKYLQSHVITLLSDLRISENYRAGLKREYYNGNLDIWYERLFGERSILNKVKDFYVVDGMTQEHIKIMIHYKELMTDNDGQIIKNDVILPENQEIAYKGYSNGMDELLLLLMALIENAASKGKTKEGENGEENVVSVYLSKTENGKLRIMNEVREKGDLSKIQFFMSRPPQPKDGISIWSISRYLLSMECSVLKNKIKKIRHELKNTFQNKENIVNLYYETRELFENLPETSVNYITNKGKIYFYIELPVMAENYKEVSDEKVDDCGRQTLGYV